MNLLVGWFFNSLMAVDQAQQNSPSCMNWDKKRSWGSGRTLSPSMGPDEDQRGKDLVKFTVFRKNETETVYI